MSEHELVELYRRLHCSAERSHEEQKTSATILGVLQETGPDALHPRWGGHGIVAEYRGRAPGPTVLLRSELDALPGSHAGGAEHRCGHDGHMAILSGVANHLGNRRPDTGRVALLFQPAEETGEGARQMLEDERFAEIEPDWVFALHNLPGYPEGEVLVRAGTFAHGSRGLAFTLTGATAHAAEPERGRSPAPAVAELITALTKEDSALPEGARATVIHVRVGEIAFGTTPGEGVVMVTLRASTDRALDRIAATVHRLAAGIADAHGLRLDAEDHEPFPATLNAPEAVDIVRAAARAAGRPVRELTRPFGWSEDFGHFTRRFRGALFGLGSGEDRPALHHPEYVFPETLLVPGVQVFDRLIAILCGKDREPV